MEQGSPQSSISLLIPLRQVLDRAEGTASERARPMRAINTGREAPPGFGARLNGGILSGQVLRVNQHQPSDFLRIVIRVHAHGIPTIEWPTSTYGPGSFAFSSRVCSSFANSRAVRGWGLDSLHPIPARS